MESIMSDVLPALGELVLRLIAAIIVLVIGWLISKWIARIVRKLLQKTNLDAKAADWSGNDEMPGVAESIGKIVYYILMIFVLVLFFEVLGLTIITEPLNALLAGVFAYIPSILAAGILVVAAWIVATILRGLTHKILETANVDQRVSDQGAPQKPSLSKALSDAVYWLIWLVFLPPILQALGMTSLVEPITSMFDDVLTFIPKLLAAGVILVVGWFIAKIVQRIVTSFLGAIGTDALSERIGLDKILGKQTLSSLLGMIVFIVILVPIVIAALDALELTALTAPLTAMLATVLTAIPAILAAAVILIVAYVIGKLVGELTATLLEGLGFDNIFVMLGLSKKPVEGKSAPSKVVGWIVMIAIILLAGLSATSLLNFPALTLVLTQFIAFAWNIIIGLAIFAIGLWLGNLIAGAVEASNLQQKGLAAMFVRIAVVVLATAMALNQMGLADSIVNLAFGLTLGAVALAIALAFGLGGREVAGRELASWVDVMHEEIAGDDAAPTASSDAEATG